MVEPPKVLVLCRRQIPRHTDHPDQVETTVMGVYASLAGVQQRLDRVARANSKYPLVEDGELRWRLGPDEDDDQGFFGDRPLELWAEETTFSP